MANTRIVTGPINTFLDDNPWDGFEVWIRLTPAVYGSTATYPERTEVVHTDANGDFAIELVTGARYQFLLVGAFTVQGRRTVYGDRNIATTVVPHGSTPISLATCVAMAADPDADLDLAALANAHLGRVDNPHSVTAAQTGAYTTGQVDNLLADKADDSALAPVAKSGDASDLTNDVPFLVSADIAHFVPDSRTINGHDLTSDVTLTTADVGLGNADNTSDADKPLSTAAINALALKADDATLATIAKTGNADDLADGASNVAMKTGERSKLAGIAAGAEVNVQADWDAASGDAAILHKPTLGTAAATDASDYATAAQGATADTALQPTDGDYLANTAARHTHANKATLGNVTAAYTTAEASKLAGIATSADVTATAIAGASAKTTPVDADTLPLTDSAASNALKKLSWADLKAKLGVPTSDGVRGKVLTIGASAPAWQDVPGIVYPLLLLSPDGSYGRSGAVSPTTTGTVSTVAGLYGNAWVVTDVTAGYVTYPNSSVTRERGTIIVRTVMAKNDAVRCAVSIGNHGGGTNQSVSPRLDGVSALVGYRNNTAAPNVPMIPVSALPAEDSPVCIGLSWDGPATTIMAIGVPAAYSYTGTITIMPSWSGSSINIGFGRLGTNTSEWGKGVESVLIYPVALPVAEIRRISSIPAAWTMDNAVANAYQPTGPWQLFTPTNKIAAGGTTARVAPGAATQDINTLAAGTLVADTGQRLTVSSVDYAMLWTQSCGQCWVPLSTLTSL